MTSSHKRGPKSVAEAPIRATGKKEVENHNLFYLLVFFFFSRLIRGKIGLPYLGKTSSPQEQRYPPCQLSVVFFVVVNPSWCKGILIYVTFVRAL